MSRPFPPDFRPPPLPAPYTSYFRGTSSTYPDTEYGYVYNGKDTVLLFYTNNRIGVMDAFGGAIHNFPTREAMMEYIRTTCTLDIWEYKGED